MIYILGREDDIMLLGLMLSEGIVAYGLPENLPFRPGRYQCLLAGRGASALFHTVDSLEVPVP